MEKISSGTFQQFNNGLGLSCLLSYKQRPTGGKSKRFVGKGIGVGVRAVQDIRIRVVEHHRKALDRAWLCPLENRL